ncbi:MAG: hypothetical protein EU539_13240 [Promethearchaeota archaeon]|nr:MAG: hypothetical protein EU539_13240 [Candidatus Lokiarchaeota archaeon]
MNQIENELVDSLKRINFIFKNEEIHAECIKDYKGFSLLGETLGPFERGKKYKLKLFIAMIFIKNNILKVASNEKCDNVDLQRFAITERDNDKLVEQENKFFLDKIKEYRFFMKEEVENGKKPYQFLDNYNSYFVHLLDSRLLKLLRMSKSQLSLEDEKRLNRSELILFKKIHKIIKEWRKFYLRENKSV